MCVCCSVEEQHEWRWWLCTCNQIHKHKYIYVWRVHAKTHRISTGEGNLIRTHRGIITHKSGATDTVNTVLGIPAHNTQTTELPCKCVNLYGRREEECYYSKNNKRSFQKKPCCFISIAGISLYTNFHHWVRKHHVPITLSTERASKRQVSDSN